MFSNTWPRCASFFLLVVRLQFIIAINVHSSTNFAGISCIVIIRFHLTVRIKQHWIKYRWPEGKHNLQIAIEFLVCTTLRLGWSPPRSLSKYTETAESEPTVHKRVKIISFIPYNSLISLIPIGNLFCREMLLHSVQENCSRLFFLLKFVFNVLFVFPWISSNLSKHVLSWILFFTLIKETVPHRPFVCGILSQEFNLIEKKLERYCARNCLKQRLPSYKQSLRWSAIKNTENWINWARKEPQTGSLWSKTTLDKRQSDSCR